MKAVDELMKITDHLQPPANVIRARTEIHKKLVNKNNRRIIAVAHNPNTVQLRLRQIQRTTKKLNPRIVWTLRLAWRSRPQSLYPSVNQRNTVQSLSEGEEMS
jgi:hypothetical protein